MILLTLHWLSVTQAWKLMTVNVLSSVPFMQSITVLVLLFMWCTQTVHAQQGQWTVLVATFYTSGLLPAPAKNILVGAERLSISTKEVRQASWVEKPSKHQVDIWYKVQVFCHAFLKPDRIFHHFIWCDVYAFWAFSWVREHYVIIEYA